jgi:hypothetical protein
MPRFELRLQNTYWQKGFFNVPVDFQRFVTMEDGPIDLYRGDSAEPVTGRVSRSSNWNATPRIFGKKALREFFATHCKLRGSIDVELVSPTAIRLGGSLR